MHKMVVFCINIFIKSISLVDRSRFEKRWMLQAFCVIAEFEGADFKKLVCKA